MGSISDWLVIVCLAQVTTLIGVYTLQPPTLEVVGAKKAGRKQYLRPALVGGVASFGKSVPLSRYTIVWAASSAAGLGGEERS